MGLFDSLFGSKSQTVTQEPLLTDQQKQAQDLLLKYGQTGQLGDFTAGQAYTGSLGDFNLSGNEQAIQSKIMELLNGGTAGGNAGRSALNDLVNVKFNPDDPSSGFSSYARQTNRAFQGGLDTLNRDAAITGDRFSTSLGRDKVDLAERNNDILGSKLAELYDSAQGRKLSASNSLLADEAQQFQNAQSAQQIAQLERQLKDAEAQSKYNEFLRQRQEKLGSINSLNTVFNRDVPYGVKSITKESPSTFMSLLGEISPVIGSYNTHEYGYDTNQSSLSDLSSILSKLYM